MKMKFGESCPLCNTKVIKIDREALNRIAHAPAPTLISVSEDQLRGKFSHVPICPQCDAEALATAFLAGHPLISKRGLENQIKQIVDRVSAPHHPMRSEPVQSIEPIRAAIHTAPLHEADPQAKIISFPIYQPPAINWDDIGTLRKRRYPNLPAQTIDVIRAFMTSTPRCKEIRSRDYYFNIEFYSADAYPPDPIPMIPGKACSVWMMDLLDRFGGVIGYGNLRAAVKREKIRYPVFQVERISNAQFVGLNDCIEPYDSFLKTRRWKIISKALKPHNLVLLFARDLIDDHRIFKGTFDADTFAIVRERILEGKECLEDILLVRNGSA
jgi:hypothetical protein